MKFTWFIALRYLFSKKKRNVINVISTISVVGVATGTLALIVVLSAFNGLEALVESLYSSFDPDIKITASYGKTFHLDSFPIEQLTSEARIADFSKVIEENCLIKYKQKQCIATLKGVEASWLKSGGLDSMMVEGELILEQGETNFAVLGYNIAYNLLLFLDDYAPMTIYAANRNAHQIINPEQAFNQRMIQASGMFAINQDFDDKYILVPFRFAQDVFGYKNEINAFEVNVSKGTNAYDLKTELQSILGPNYRVKTRFELNEIIFKTNKSEKWITFMILSFILVIATFNVAGSLTMLILEKTSDVFILRSFGADEKSIRRIFLIEGFLITFLGGVSGLVLGALLCFVQSRFGLIRLESMVTEFYPVLMDPVDFVYILLTVVVIGMLVSWIPVRFVLKSPE